MARPKDKDNKQAVAFVAELDKRANVVRDESKSDVFFLTGPIKAGLDFTALEVLEKFLPKQKAAILVLCTYGGNPDVAYRIARAFWKHYEEFTVLVDGYCFSAGTLIAVGADELALSQCAVLGPLDTQIAKIDELFSNTSGLTGVAALEAIREQAYQAFESTLVDMKLNLPSEVTLKTAIDASVRLTTGLYAPIFGQIDPLKLGEDRRALDIAKHYGTRLSKKSDNLKPGTLEKLLIGYPSHNFVIDPAEARDLFKIVRNLTDSEILMTDWLGGSRVPHDDGIFFAVSDPITQINNQTKENDTEKDHAAANGSAKNARNAKGADARDGQDHANEKRPNQDDAPAASGSQR